MPRNERRWGRPGRPRLEDTVTATPREVLVVKARLALCERQAKKLGEMAREG